MLVLIEFNTEDIRTTIEGIGYKYVASYPPKNYGEAIAIHPSTRTYSVWSNGDRFKEVLKNLKKNLIVSPS